MGIQGPVLQVELHCPKRAEKFQQRKPVRDAVQLMKYEGEYVFLTLFGLLSSDDKSTHVFVCLLLPCS